MVFHGGNYFVECIQNLMLLFDDYVANSGKCMKSLYVHNNLVLLRLLYGKFGKMQRNIWVDIVYCTMLDLNAENMLFGPLFLLICKKYLKFRHRHGYIVCTEWVRNIWLSPMYLCVNLTKKKMKYLISFLDLMLFSCKFQSSLLLIAVSLSFIN